MKLPAYVYDDPEGKSLREQIVEELKFSEGDGRKAWLLQKTCETVFSRLNSKIQMNDLIKICMSDRACVIRSEAGLRTAFQEIFAAMQKQYYCNTNKGTDGNFISVVFIEPWIGKADDYLRRLYGRTKGYAFEKSQIYQFAVFPMIGQLANKLSIREEILSGMCKDVQTNTYTLEDMSILENQTKFTGLLKINFDEQELGGGFHIVLSGNDQFPELVKNGIVAFLINIVRKNVNLDASLKDAVRVKTQQTAVAAGGVGASASTSTQQTPSAETELVEIGNWEFWIVPLKKILLEYHSRGTLEKCFSKSFTNQYGNVEKIFLFIIKSVCIACRYFELREMKEVQSKERELGLAQDAIHIEKVLINSGKTIRDDEGGAISLFQPMHLNTLFYSKDRLDQKKLIERYSTAELNQIVSERNPDKKHPRIFSIKDHQDNVYFIHIWRLSDVILSMIQLETPGLTAKLLKKYTKDSFPPPEVPLIEESDLSPLFVSVYNLAMSVYSSFASQQEALEYLSPSLNEVNTYDLGASEIGSMTNDTDLARSKYATTVDFLFEERSTSIARPLEKVLGINRSFIEESLGVKQTSRKKSGLFEVVSSFVWKIFTLKWISSLGEIAMSALENDHSPQTTSNSSNSPHTKSPGETFGSKSSEQPSSQKPLLEELRKKISSIPNSKKDIQNLIEHHHEQWNVAIEDPIAYYPNWNQMGFAEKQRVQQNLRKEIENRKRVSRDVVDSSLMKHYSNISIKGFDEFKLDAFCEKVAKEFKTNRPTQLKEYIKYYLIYINTN